MNLDFQYLFTSFEGRINRAKYWAGTIILAVISIVLGFVIGAIFGASTFGAILIVLVTLALFYPGYAVAAKRFQDRDKPGITALYGLVPVLIASLLAGLRPHRHAARAERARLDLHPRHHGRGPVVPDRAWHPQGHARAQSLRRRSLGCRAVDRPLRGRAATGAIALPNDRARRQGRSAQRKA